MVFGGACHVLQREGRRGLVGMDCMLVQIEDFDKNLNG